MVGKGVLLECLDSSLVKKVTMVNRRPLDIVHPKISEIIIPDFQQLSGLKNSYEKFDACFYCMGISAMGISEQKYTAITYDITIDFANILVGANPNMTFCYVSGAGTDASSNTMWARVKGRTEEDLLKMPFRNVYLFRPGYIQPLNGIKSQTSWYNTIYAISSPFYPLVKSLFPGLVTDTTKVGQAMIRVATSNMPNQYLTNRDINRLAASAN